MERDDNTPTGRIYSDGDKRYPSVTSILSILLPKKLTREWPVRQAIRTAVANPGMKEAELVELALHEMMDAARRGTAVHEAIEYDLAPVRPHQLLDDPAAVAMFKQFVAWKDKQDLQPEAVEALVVNDSPAYAGTVDFIGLLNGARFLIDWKTGRSLHRTIEMQLAAYRYADRIVVGDTGMPMPPIEHVGILHIRPTSCNLIAMSASLLQQYSDFCKTAEVFAIRDEYQERIR